MLTQVFHLHALSALHVGVGQSIGAVDLPIARAKATHLPQVPGSALKGVLREDTGQDGEHARLLFGPADAGQETHAGALAFGDAHLLLLPVRSWAGVMAWATCPFVLRRYLADLRLGEVGSLPDAVPAVALGQARCSADSEVSIATIDGSRVALDDLDFVAVPEGAEAWAELLGERLFGADAGYFMRHFLILSDEDFSFLADTATEVRARIRINHDTGTVEDGALWYEENLPGESVLWGVIGIGPARDGRRDEARANRTREEVRKIADAVLGRERIVQIGGKATVGRGLVRFLSGVE